MTQHRWSLGSAAPKLSPKRTFPWGAFDAPVDPAPWVAGLGAIGTALWGVVAVRRRLVMAQQLAIFESQVLSNSAVEADAVAVPNAGHQAL